MFGEFTIFKCWQEKVWRMNRSAKGLLIVTTTLDGFSLVNHRRFAKFAKLSTCQTFYLPNFPAIWYIAHIMISYIYTPCSVLSVCCLKWLTWPFKRGQDKEQYQQTATPPMHTHLAYWQWSLHSHTKTEDCLQNQQ